MDIQRICELLEEKQYRQLRETLEDINPADIALLLEELDENSRAVVFRLLSKTAAAESFVELESSTQSTLIRVFSDRELKEIVNELYVDDFVDIVEEMPANVVRRILNQTDAQTRRVINEILKYPDDSAGSVMTVEYVALKSGMTVADALANIKRTGIDKETIYNCYVVDSNRHLLGVVTAKSLLLADSDEAIDNLAERDIISVTTLEDREDVAKKFAKYDLLAIPVVDSENRLVGIVTVDDAIDVLEEEATEDIEKMAAITPTDKPYFHTGVIQTWLKRIPWLLLMMVTATFTGLVIQQYETALAAQVALTAFIPMLMGTAGNSGSQASVSIIRALSLGDITMRDFFRVVSKELRVSVLCGVTLAAANFVKMLIFDRVDIMISATVCLTLVITVIFAKLFGSILPILAKRVGFDPAVMAAPFITTVVDTLSLLVYFNVATTLLGI